MRWSKALPLILLAGPAWALDGYILGGGVEADSADGLAAAVFADIGLSEKTRLSAALGKSSVELPRGVDLDTSYGDIGLDYWFDPVGIRMEVAYWGDNDFLDSIDWRGGLYWRNDKVTVSGNLEYRDFEFDIFGNDAVPGRNVRFHAKGVGLSARFQLNDALSLNVMGIDYRYNVNLNRGGNRDIMDFLSVSRLSLINSLIDYRAGGGLGLDIGEQRWDLDYRTWKAEVDGSITHSATLNLTTPIGQRGDIQFGLGVDDSDTYGSITFFTVQLFFYGGI
jgi:hypothetical protein